uniref:ATP synthase complex subunit 8 n=1 Tax=Pachypanchax playfairii TaxID=52664 RepID=A0A517FL61_9TELE|nr:ATP synthase F0 subunit 8 [Pachypanchax playfairii]QDS02600.1 ATP synthase F0 subunit 8 [Pachypanchax playfairii]UPT34500.1 ATP synthase F0 subunit 8 [Pachypanchax playfairii]
MPQLNPAPWFMLMIFSWLVFTTVIPPKVMGHAFPNDAAPKTTKKTETSPWNWPWH